MKRIIAVLLLAAASVPLCEPCSAQKAEDARLNFFQVSAAGGIPSRELQVSGPLHQYTFTASSQFSEKTLPGYYGPGGYYPSVGFTLGLYHYDRARFPGGTPYANHYSLSLHFEQTFWGSGPFTACYYLENGMGYTSSCFDPLNNPESTYGGNFHIAFQAGALVSWYASDHIRLSLGPAYSHHSNSKTNFVNTGCDAVSLAAAVTYLPGRIEKTRHRTTVDEMGVRKRYWDVKYAACITGGGFDDLSRMWTYASHTVNAAHLWRAFRRAALGVGADAFFDRGGNEKRNALGLCGKIDCYLTRNIVVAMSVGAYLNGPAANGSPIYETVGMNYCADSSNRLYPYVGFYTKANAGKAEHLELVLGFRI